MENFADRPADPSLPGPDPAPGEALAPLLVIYTLLRVAVVAALCLLLTSVLGIPFIVALALSIVIQLPLSMVLFIGYRRRINAVLAIRAAERIRLHEALRGDLP